MQNVTIAIIIITFELGLLGLAGLSFLWFRWRSGGRTRGGRGANVMEYRQLAHRLARTHGILMAQYAALNREFNCESSDNEALRAAEAGLRKSIEQLRLAASQLALGIAGAEQISLDLLGAQESLLVAFDACTRISQFRNEGGSGSSTADASSPAGEKMAIADISPATNPANESQSVQEVSSEEDLEPPMQSPPPVDEPVTKTDVDLQDEIDALMSPAAEEPQPEKLQSEEPQQPEEPPRKMTEAEIEAEMQAELDAMIAGSQSAAPPSETGLQTEILEEKVPSSDLPEPPPRKMTEAEIEAEMQADLDAMLAASKSAIAADPQAEIDALLNQNPRETAAAAPENIQETAVAELENISVEEIDAGIQAELEALLAPGWQDKPEQKSTEDDLQAEINALLGGGLELPKAEVASAPAPTPVIPEQAKSDLDLQAEIDALLAGESQEPLQTVAPSTPKPSSSPITRSDLDLQAEIDALLGEQDEKPDSQIQIPEEIKEPLTSQADLDLQAEIDALMADEQSKPESQPSPALKAINEINRQSEGLTVSSSLSSVTDLQAEIDALFGAQESTPDQVREKPMAQAAPTEPPSGHGEGKSVKGPTDDLQAEIDALLGLGLENLENELLAKSAVENQPASASASPSSPKNQSEVDLQAEIDALFSNSRS